MAVTPCRGTLQAFGTAVHTEPFQRRMSHFWGNPVAPTAHTSVEETAATADSPFGRASPARFERGTSRHAAPSQCSGRVVLFSEATSSADPTAHTSLEETPETSLSADLSTPGQSALGLGTMVKLDPSQCSVKVRLPVSVGGSPGLYSPTTQTSVGDNAFTPARAFWRSPWLGLSTVPQTGTPAAPACAPPKTNSIAPTAARVLREMFSIVCIPPPSFNPSKGTQARRRRGTRFPYGLLAIDVTPPRRASVASTVSSANAGEGYLATGARVADAAAPTGSDRHATRRGGPRLVRGSPHQDLGDAGHAPSAHPRGGRSLPLADRRRAIVGAPELAALLRRDP